MINLNTELFAGTEVREFKLLGCLVFLATAGLRFQMFPSMATTRINFYLPSDKVCTNHTLNNGTCTS